MATWNPAGASAEGGSSLKGGSLGGWEIGAIVAFLVLLGLLSWARILSSKLLVAMPAAAVGAVVGVLTVRPGWLAAAAEDLFGAVKDRSQRR